MILYRQIILLTSAGAEGIAVQHNLARFSRNPFCRNMWASTGGPAAVQLLGLPVKGSFLSRFDVAAANQVALGVNRLPGQPLPRFLIPLPSTPPAKQRIGCCGVVGTVATSTGNPPTILYVNNVPAGQHLTVGTVPVCLASAQAALDVVALLHPPPALQPPAQPAPGQ